MDGMLLHLDDELHNNRRGHSYNTDYSARDLAFWLQFYSLFYDQVLVPAHFIVELNLMPKILAELRFSNAQSLLCHEESPFRIVWDNERYPYDSFTELAANCGEADVTLAQPEVSKRTAAMCEKYLQHNVIRRSFTRAHNDESIRLLRERLFCPGENWALSTKACSRLREILECVVDRGGLRGYGRNFFYSVFGYGTTAAQKEVAMEYEDITAKYGDMQHVFLSAVDNASHTIKAKVASESLERPVAALLPSEYQRVFRPPLIESLWFPDHPHWAKLEVRAKEGQSHLLDRDAIISMTADKFLAIRKGDEYRRFSHLLDATSNSDLSAMEDQRVGELTDALDDYIAKIERILTPMRYHTGRSISIVARTYQWSRGLAMVCCLGAAGAALTGLQWLVPLAALAAIHTAIGHAAAWGTDMIRSGKEVPFAGFQLSQYAHVLIPKEK